MLIILLLFKNIICWNIRLLCTFNTFIIINFTIHNNIFDLFNIYLYYESIFAVLRLLKKDTIKFRVVPIDF